MFSTAKLSGFHVTAKQKSGAYASLFYYKSTIYKIDSKQMPP